MCLSYFVFLRTFFAPFCFVRAEFYSPVHKKTRGGCAFAQPLRVTGFPFGGSCPLCVSPFQGFPSGGSCPLCGLMRGIIYPAPHPSLTRHLLPREKAYYPSVIPRLTALPSFRGLPKNPTLSDPSLTLRMTVKLIHDKNEIRRFTQNDNETLNFVQDDIKDLFRRH